MSSRKSSIVRLLALAGLLGGAVVYGAAPSLTPDQYPLAKLPIVDRIKVPVGPGWLEVGFGSVWVTKSNSRLALRIDPSTDRVIARIPLGADPELGIGMGLGFVWIADPKDHTVTQIDPRTNRVVRAISVRVAADPEGSIGVGAGSVWLLTDAGGTYSGTLTRIDAASGRVVANIPVKPKSHAATFAFGSVWVTSTGSGSVTRVDPSSNAVVAEISVHAAPRFLLASKQAVWVLCQSDGTLIRVDPNTNRVAASVAVGVPGDGGDLSYDDGYMWVSAEGVPVSQIDPDNNKLLRQFVGGSKDDTLRVGFGSAWVLDENGGEIWRIDLKRLESLSQGRD